MMNAALSNAPTTDADLVAQSLAGNRDAFGVIVSRYQSLVCSIAYSATGSLPQSEDLAQETFLTAWKQLSALREPERLRAWLCGITRNLIHGARRKDSREPALAAEPIEFSAESAAPEAPPAEEAINREEQALLWRSLEQIPETYREPLVLFYREQQSVEHVSQALGLTEEAVRQRLSRGRKLLHEQVLSFVEGALERSGPSRAFTAGVLASLPFFTTSATAATVAATAAKGSAVAQGAGLAAAISAALAPFAWIFGSYLGVRCSLAAARTPRERAYVWSQTKTIFAGVLLFLAALGSVFLFGQRWAAYPRVFTALAIAIPLGYAAWMTMMMLRFTRDSAALRKEELRLHPECFTAETAAPRHAWGEYRSRARLFGIPLAHIQYGVPNPGASEWAVGWIAIGHRSAGILFSLGAVSVGGISIGTVSAGIISAGAASVGLISMGGATLGLLAAGGISLGLFAAGGLVLGWIGSLGAFAIAGELAMGANAFAPHANDAAARAFFARHNAEGLIQAMLAAVTVLSIGPAGWMSWKLRRKRGDAAQSAILKNVENAATSSATAREAQPATMPEAPSRHPALSHLKAFIIALVVAHHAVLAYHPYAPPSGPTLSAEPRLWQAFPVVDAQKWKGTDVFVGFNDTFFMALMFLLSGLFVWPSLQRKGAGKFCGDRCARLGLSFAASVLLLAPLAYFPSYQAIHRDWSISGFLREWLALGVAPAGPGWFLWVLLAFGCLAAAAFKAFPRWAEGPARLWSGSERRPFRAFLALIVLFAAAYLPLAHWVEPSSWAAWGPFVAQTSRILLYALYFTTGITLGAWGLQRGLLASDGNLARRWPLWTAGAIAAFIFSVGVFLAIISAMTRGEAATGLRTLGNFAFVLSGAASSFMMMALFVRFCNGPSRLLGSLSQNAFGIYLLHYIFVNWLQLALLPAPLPGWGKGMVVIAGGLGLSWAATAALRRIPALARVL